MSANSATPTLSVVVVSFNRPALLERCLTSLQDQDPGEGVEYLIVRHAPSNEDGTTKLKEKFHEFRWIATTANVPRMRGIGMSQSTGEVIALIEDDCVAERSWVRKLREAHRSASAAIGGIVEPGEYQSSLDWAVYFSEYGCFMGASSNDALPGTNVSYKRSALEKLPEINGRGLDQYRSNGFYEAFTHQALRRDGARLHSVSTLAVTNIRAWERREALESRYHHARGYAAMRVGSTPGIERVGFALGALLLPPLLIFRISNQVRSRRGFGYKLARAMPWIFALSASWSIGEFIGYLLGPGDSLDRWR